MGEPAASAVDGAPGGARLRLAGLGGRTLAVLAVLALLVAAADRSRVRWDWSADGRFSLGASLTRILDQQREPVELVGIWNADQAAALGIDPEPIAAAAEAMAARNPRIAWRRIDPALHLQRLAAFAETYHQPVPPALYVCRGKRAFRIPLGPWTARVLQREVGGALLALADPQPPTAYLLAGHGELLPGAGGADGAGTLVRALELGGFQVVTGPRPTIPADWLLVLPGPTAPLGAPALQLLDEHCRDGGAVLLFADDRTPADLALALRRRGVLLAGGMPRALLQGDLASLFDDAAPALPATVLVSLRRHETGQDGGLPHHHLRLDGDLVDPTHPATRGVAGSGRAVLSPRSTRVWMVPLEELAGEDRTSLEQRFAALGTPPFASQPLLATAPGDAWLKRWSDPLAVPDGLAGLEPSPIAWAVSYAPRPDSVRHGRGARLVVWGSRQAASDAVLDQEQYANQALIVDLARWLADRGQAADIPESATAVFQVRCTTGTLSVLMAVLVAVLPCVAIGGAMLAWWSRRRS